MKISRLYLCLALLVLLVTLVSCTPGGKQSKHAQVTSQPIVRWRPQQKGHHMTPLIWYYCNENTWECKAFTYGSNRRNWATEYFPTKEECMKSCRGHEWNQGESGNSNLLTV